MFSGEAKRLPKTTGRWGVPVLDAGRAMESIAQRDVALGGSQLLGMDENLQLFLVLLKVIFYFWGPFRDYFFIFLGFLSKSTFSCSLLGLLQKTWILFLI